MSYSLIETLLQLPSSHIQLEKALRVLYHANSSILLLIMDLMSQEEYHRAQTNSLATSYIICFINNEISRSVLNDQEFEFSDYWPHIASLLKSPHISFDDKKLLFKAGISIISKATWEDLSRVGETLNDLFELGENEKKAGLLLVEIIIERYYSPEELRLIAPNILRIIRETIAGTVHNIKLEFIQINQDFFSLFTKQTHRMDELMKANITFGIFCLNTYIKLVEQIEEYISKNPQMIEILSEEFKSNAFSSIFSTIYDVKVSVFPQTSKIISTFNKEYDSLLNKLKQKAFQIHGLMIRCEAYSKQIKINQHNYLSNITECVRNTLQSVFDGFNDLNNNSSLELDGLMGGMIQFLTIIIQHNIVQEQSPDLLVPLLSKLIFKGLQLNKKELMMYQQQPNAFVDFYKGVFEQGEEERVEGTKINLARLFLTVLRKIVPAAAFMVLNAVEGIKKNLNCEAPREKNVFDMQIGDYLTDTYFTILSLMPSKVKKRRDSRRQITELINMEKPMELSGVNLSCMLNFLRNNFELLIPETKTKYLSIAISHSDSKSDITLSYYCYKYILVCYRGDLMKQEDLFQIFQRVLYSQNQYLFRLMGKIIKDYEERLSREMVVYLVETLLARVVKDCEMNSEYQLNDSMCYCLNMIIDITSNTHYLKQHPEVITATNPIIQFMSHLHTITYSQKIVSIYYNTILTHPYLGSQQFQYLTNILLYLRTQQLVQPVFEILSYFIVKGEEYIRGNPSVFREILNAIEGTVSVIDWTGSVKCYSVSMGFLLLQMIINQYGEMVEDYQYIKKCCQFYLGHEELQKDAASIRMLKSKVVNTWILGSLYSPLFDLSTFEEIPLSNIGLYDLKVFIFSMSRVFIERKGEEITYPLFDLVLECLDELEMNRGNLNMEYVDVENEIESVPESVFNDVNVLVLCQQILRYVLESQQKFVEISHEVMKKSECIQKYLKYELIPTQSLSSLELRVKREQRRKPQPTTLSP